MAVSRGSLGSTSGGGGGGTTTANQGTAAATSSAWPVKVIDTAGTNVASVSAAGAIKVDNSANTQPVSGSVTVSGTVSSTQGTAAATSGAWPTKLVDSAGTNVAAISASGAVKTDGSAVTQPISGTTTSNQGTPGTVANSWNVKITDGTSVATIVSNAYIGNVQAVENGFILPAVTINSASGNISGAAVDAGAAKSNWSAFAVPTGTLAGTLTLQLSYDGGNWFDSSVTGSLTAATNLALYSTGRAARYARVNLSGATGTGTVTINMMAAS